jgi:hypothetical protein
VAARGNITGKRTWSGTADGQAVSQKTRQVAVGIITAVIFRSHMMLSQFDNFFYSHRSRVNDNNNISNNMAGDGLTSSFFSKPARN